MRFRLSCAEHQGWARPAGQEDPIQPAWSLQLRLKVRALEKPRGGRITLAGSVLNMLMINGLNGRKRI